jgi:hypothetical protein
VQQRPDERDRLYSSLRGILDEIDPPVPEPLRQLAEITDFQLFVSTTLDDLLAHAVDAVRFDGRADTERRWYVLPQWAKPPAKGQETIEQLITRASPVVYRIFGEVSPVERDCCAVTEADTLEFVHQVQAAPPVELFDVIDRKQLLFLGCGFPDWLSRFFVRAMKRQPLSTSRLAAVVDDLVRGEERLVLFLKQNKTLVYRAGGAVDFVARLHERWRADQEKRMTPRAPAPAGRPSEPLADGGVFLSFSSVDRDAVRAVKKELDNLRIAAWFDESGLEPGEEWRAVIEQSIERCALFVPFVSARALATHKKFFWAEWRLALEQAPQFAPHYRFIVPVALDDTPPAAEGVPRDFREYQWIRADGAPEKLALSIRDVLRANKRAQDR